ncbi:MAG: hypothetical protein N2321_04640 [Melioribacteraceae bacterium]|nr:hypothetical protein [Melioribacteraceae bacterium]
MKKILLGLFFLFLSTLSAQINELGGLLFRSNNFPFDQRTSLNLTSERKIIFENKLTINFDLSIETPRYYGYILRIFSNGFKAELIYVQFQNKDTSYLQLVINNKSINEKIPIAKKSLYRNNWFNVQLSLNKNNSEIKLSLNKNFEIREKTNLKNEEIFDLVFGILDYGVNIDVPEMKLRNIKIFSNNNLINFWPLNEFHGNRAKDIISGVNAFVKNPNWAIKNNYQFKKVGQVGPFPIKNEEPISLIVFSEKNEKFYFIVKDFMISYEIENHKIEKVYFKNPLLHYGNMFLLDDKFDKFYAYYDGLGKVSIFDNKTLSWSKIDTTGEHLGHFYVHNSFINPLDNQLYMICGYGWYTFKNILQRYDFEKKEWIKVKTKGDFLVPRLSASFCKMNNNGDFLIFGGYGNESGNQIDGTKQLKDLYILSMKDTSIKKIGKITNVPLYFKAYQSMYYDSLKNQLYILGHTKYNESEAKRTSSLYRYDFKTKNFECVSDSLVSFHDVGNPIFFSKKFNELYAFERTRNIADSFMVNIYSLNFPPISRNLYNKLAKPETSFFDSINSSLLLIIISLVSIIGGSFYFINRNKRRPLFNKENYNNESDFVIPIENKTSKKNSIYLFGNFELYDNEGNEISLQFTPKLKQIFLLLLIKSYNGSTNGISTESLSSFIWPELNSEQTKNNRNVSLSKLRSIINKLDKLEINIEKNILKLIISENVYCDYITLKQLLDKEQLSFENIQQINEIVSRGEFLQECSFDWLDGIKVNFIENCIYKIKELINKNNIDSKYKLLLADSILKLDSANEDALSLKIKILLELGDHKTAKNNYEHFKKEYFSLYAEEYEKNFKEFLN